MIVKLIYLGIMKIICFMHNKIVFIGNRDGILSIEFYPHKSNVACGIIRKEMYYSVSMRDVLHPTLRKILHMRQCDTRANCFPKIVYFSHNPHIASRLNVIPSYTLFEEYGNCGRKIWLAQ